MASLKKAGDYLAKLDRGDLAELISKSRFEIQSCKNILGFYEPYSLTLYAPEPFCEALKILNPYDENRICEAICATEHEAQTYNFKTYTVVREGDVITGLSSLLAEALIHKTMLINVATGKSSIQDVNDYYRGRQLRIISLTRLAQIAYANEFEDLWDWFSYYKKNLPTYRERTNYINSLFKPTFKALYNTNLYNFERELTGWDKVDRALEKAKQQFKSAKHEEDYQSIGLLCREILISVAQAVYDPNRHEPLDEVIPSRTDAARMLDAFIHYSFAGAGNKELRAHSKTSINLALNLQHRRTATKQLAALCLEATSSAAAVIKILNEDRL